MDSKQNQPNLGSTSSSSAANKSAASSAATSAASSDSFEATTGLGQQPGALGASSRSTQGSTDKAASTAESNQPQSGERKSWLNQDELLKGVNQLPQSLKDLGTKAVEQFNGLSSTQKVVGGALLVSGLSWLALRNKKSKSSSDIYAPYNPKSTKADKSESKWKSSNESVYRGAATNRTDFGTENGF